MSRVLFIVPMDAERRAAVARASAGAFEPVILEDLPPEERDDAWSTADVVVSMGFPREFPADFRQKARKVRMIQSLVAGIDHFPFDRFPPSAIVCSNAGAYSVSVAEHAMALLLAAAKDIVLRTDEIRRGIFDQGVTNKALAGSTVVILGLGGIGSEIARRCKAFDRRVVGIARSRNARGVADEIGTVDDLPRHLPGKLIVEDDLFDHLKAHPKFRAALDTWWTYPDTKQGRPFHRPFQDLPNIIMTPHVAPMVPGQRARAMEAALANVLRFLHGEKPHNVVDPADYAKPGATLRGRGEVD